jgi:hypothetical protein
MGLDAQVGPKPQWWALYVTMLTLVALVWLLEVSVQAAAPRAILEIFVVVCAFGVMQLWVRSNRGALDIDRGGRRG